MAQAEGYHCLFTHCEVHKKSSYSGVATFIRSESGLKTLASTTSLGDSVFFGSPGSVAGGLSPDRLRAIDSEGRVLVTDHGHFVLLNVYAPYTRCAPEAGLEIIVTMSWKLRTRVASQLAQGILVLVSGEIPLNSITVICL